MLKFVRDYMRTGAEIPVKPEGTKMSEAVVEMSAKGLGCVCIVNAAGEAVGSAGFRETKRHVELGIFSEYVATK